MNTQTKHTINLSEKPLHPFAHAEVVKHECEINGKSVVEIELCSDDNLYIDSKKVVIILSERQIGDKLVVGHELRVDLENDEQVLLNSNVLDYLYDHPELFPEHWKEDENGKTRFVYFWGSIFEDVYGTPCVRHIYWGADKPRRNYNWLKKHWCYQCPSAVLEK